MIFVECKPDVILVRSLTNIARRQIVHAGNKAEVCKRLEKQSNCKGLLDEDPWATQPRYIKNLKVVNDLPQEGLKVLYDEKRNNRLVVLCPRLEELILKLAKESNLVRKHSLPNSPEKFHAVINLDLNKFEKVVKDLKNSGKLKPMKELLK